MSAMKALYIEAALLGALSIFGVVEMLARLLR